MPSRASVRAVALAVGATLAACVPIAFNPATNSPLDPHAAGMPFSGLRLRGDHAIGLAFSGGGLRAAAFSHGVLTALADSATPNGDLLEDVAFISSVSGGSLTAGHYGVYGRDGLENFRRDVLLRDFERDMRLSLLHPANVLRLLGGGLNGRKDVGEALDRHVFRGATFSDIERKGGPDVRIHATDVYHRVAFPFIPRVFEQLCSDLSGLKVAEAVEASMAVPLIFAPVVLRTYPDRCHAGAPAYFSRIKDSPAASRLSKAAVAAMSSYRDRKDVQYIKLVDGGLTDNLGLSTIVVARDVLGTPYAPMTEPEAVQVRRLLLIVVDASKGPSGEWISREPGPWGVDLALYASEASVDASARLAADAFAAMVLQWERSVIDFRCALAPRDLARHAPPKAWRCDDVRFSVAFLSIDQLQEPLRSTVEAIPTRLTLRDEQIDAAIEGGRVGVLALPQLRDYLATRATGVGRAPGYVGRPPPPTEATTPARRRQ